MTDSLNFWFTFCYKKNIHCSSSYQQHYQWHFPIVPVFYWLLYTNMHRCSASSANQTKTMMGGKKEERLKNLTYILWRTYNAGSICDCLSLFVWKNLWNNVKSFCACSSAVFLSNWWASIHASTRILLGVHLRLIKLLRHFVFFFLFKIFTSTPRQFNLQLSK